MIALQNPINRFKVKESTIPLDAIYNEQLNTKKVNE